MLIRTGVNPNTIVQSIYHALPVVHRFAAKKFEVMGLIASNNSSPLSQNQSKCQCNKHDTIARYVIGSQDTTPVSLSSDGRKRRIAPSPPPLHHGRWLGCDTLRGCFGSYAIHHLSSTVLPIYVHCTVIFIVLRCESELLSLPISHHCHGHVQPRTVHAIGKRHLNHRTRSASSEVAKGV